MILSLTNMPEYHIKSAKLQTKVTAQNAKIAIIKALDETDAKKLGYLISALEDGKPEESTIYFSTIKELEKIGLLKKEKL